MYLDVSFIFPKSYFTRRRFFMFLEKEYGLTKGQNMASAFNGRKVIVFILKINDTDYDEICVDFADQVFHEETFEKEVAELTGFVNNCFEHNPKLKYALCSYELNGYFLSDIKRLKDFDDNLLKRFPFAYKREEAHKPPILQINKEAQDVF